MSRMYAKVFGFEGFEVTVAENGREGLDKLAEFTPDLILLDVMMPVMNGIDTLDALKADTAHSQIPVIMLTNLAGKNDAETALAKGAAQYIIKSEHEPTEVVAIVNEFLGKQSTAAPSAQQ